VIEVDHRQCHERPGKEQGGRRLPVPAEAPDDGSGEERRGEFDDRVAREIAAPQLAHLPPSSR